MPDEYDAFGRKVEDSGLGWDTTASPTESTPPQHSTVATPTEFQTVKPVASGLSRPRRNPAILLVQILVIAGIIGAIVLAITAGNKANDTVRRTLDDFKVQTGGGGGGGSQVDDGDDTVPEQVRIDSFFSPKGLRAGLKILAAEQPGKITNFSMRKDRIDLQVVRGGKSHVVELQAGAEAPQEFSVSTATASGIDTLSYEELNPTAPDRLMRAANARLGTSPKQVDYFVAQKFTGTLQWGVYYKNSKIAQGDSRGRFTRRIS